jgi:alpha-amylase
MNGPIEEKNGSGLAVLMTTGIACSKRMEIGLRHAGELFRDICNHCPEKVLIDAEGFGIFYVNDGSVSVWIQDDVFPN